MSNKAATKVHSGHSIFMTETFVFGVFVAVAALALPVFFAGSWEGWMSSGKPRGTAQAIQESVETLITAAENRPIPYLRRLPNLFPYIISAPTYLRPLVFDWPYAIFGTLFGVLSIPIMYTLGILAQLFAPVIILAQVTFHIFVQVPWNAFTWILRFLYPIYVFCGIAALVGVLFGLAGAGVGKVGLRLTAKEIVEEEHYGRRSSRSTSPSPRRKGKSREIKREASVEAPRRTRRVEFAST